MVHELEEALGSSYVVKKRIAKGSRCRTFVLADTVSEDAGQLPKAHPAEGPALAPGQWWDVAPVSL